MQTAIHISASVAKARNFVGILIEKQKKKGQLRMPTIIELAELCRCSTTTISRAIDLLKDKGVLSVSQRTGIRITGCQSAGEQLTPPPINTIHHKRWEVVFEQIVAGIRDGTYQPGALLPTAKELSHAYGACFTTIKKALMHLVETGKIVPFQKRYRVFQPKAHQARACVIYIAWTDNLLHLQTYTPASKRFWSALEEECERCNVELAIVHIKDMLKYQKAKGEVLNQTLGRGRTVLGYLIGSLSFAIEDLDSLITIVTRSGKPISILDDGESKTRFVQAARHPLCRKFTVSASSLAGEIVGNYLLGNGHRKVACFQLSRDTEFCRNRTAGLEQAFHLHGLSHNVITFLLPQGTMVDVEDKVNDQVNSIVGMWVKHSGLSAGSPNFAEALRFQPDLRGLVWANYMQNALRPLFERALRAPDITAWVAINDPCGIAALNYLKENTIAVPERVSVIAFDDSLEAFGKGLSSFNFNIAPLVHEMLSHLIHRNEILAGKGEEPIEIPGRIVARESTGKKRMIS